MANPLIEHLQERHNLLKSFEQQTGNAIDALFNWRSLLRTWQHDGRTIPDDAFMTHVNDLAKAGLLEFVDGNELDRLRELVTGKETN